MLKSHPELALDATSLEQQSLISATIETPFDIETLTSAEEVGTDLVRRMLSDSMNYETLSALFSNSLEPLGDPSELELDGGGSLFYFADSTEEIETYLNTDRDLAAKLSHVLTTIDGTQIIVLPFDSRAAGASAPAYNVGIPNAAFTALDTVVLFVDRTREDLEPYVIGNELDEAILRLVTGRPPTGSAAEEATTRAVNRLLADKLENPSDFNELSQRDIAQLLSNYYFEGLLLYANNGLPVDARSDDATVSYLQTVSNYLSSRLFENGLLQEDSSDGVATIGAVSYSDTTVRLIPLLYLDTEQRVLLPEDLTVPTIPLLRNQPSP